MLFKNVAVAPDFEWRFHPAIQEQAGTFDFLPPTEPANREPELRGFDAKQFVWNRAFPAIHTMDSQRGWRDFFDIFRVFMECENPFTIRFKDG